ncbi:MAG TPA: hypothetical protein VHX68_10710 [Planctomycetaceae bacterium]|jgi:hypothetical protein|nr:hypothetical protein [Planctomycetaceae bacterium]
MPFEGGERPKESIFLRLVTESERIHGFWRKGLKGFRHNQIKSRATTDRTDFTDKKVDEAWQFALNPPRGFASAPMAEWRNEPLDWNLSLVLIRVICEIRGLTFDHF